MSSGIALDTLGSSSSKLSATFTQAEHAEHDDEYESQPEDDDLSDLEHDQSFGPVGSERGLFDTRGGMDNEADRINSP